MKLQEKGSPCWEGPKCAWRSPTKKPYKYPPIFSLPGNHFPLDGLAGNKSCPPILSPSSETGPLVWFSPSSPSPSLSSLSHVSSLFLAHSALLTSAPHTASTSSSSLYSLPNSHLLHLCLSLSSSLSSESESSFPRLAFSRDPNVPCAGFGWRPGRTHKTLIPHPASYRLARAWPWKAQLWHNHPRTPEPWHSQKSVQA